MFRRFLKSKTFLTFLLLCWRSWITRTSYVFRSFTPSTAFTSILGHYTMSVIRCSPSWTEPFSLWLRCRLTLVCRRRWFSGALCCLFSLLCSSSTFLSSNHGWNNCRRSTRRTTSSCLRYQQTCSKTCIFLICLTQSTFWRSLTRFLWLFHTYTITRCERRLSICGLALSLWFWTAST